MTFEEKLDRLCRLNFYDGRESGLVPEEYKEKEMLKQELEATYNLLESEYRSWSALALAWFKWADTLAYTDQASYEEYKKLVDRTIVNVG